MDTNSASGLCASAIGSVMKLRVLPLLALVSLLVKKAWGEEGSDMFAEIDC